MLSIKEEIRIVLLRKGISMRKLVVKMRENGYKIPKGLSDALNKKRIKFETVQEILDFCGYKLEIKEK